MKKISKEDFFELDPMEIDEKYGEYLTDEDREDLERVFNDEEIDDQEYIEKLVNLIYQRAQENDLVS